MFPPCIAGAVPRGWSWGCSLTLHIKYKSQESVNHLFLQGVPVPAREEQLNEQVPREIQMERKLDIFGGVGVVFFTSYLTVTFLISFTSLPSALQSEAKGGKVGPDQDWSTRFPGGRRCWSRTKLPVLRRTTSPWRLSSCVHWLTLPIPSPWVFAARGHACSPLLIWTCLSSSLIRHGERLKNGRKTNLERNTFFCLVLDRA